MDFGNYVSMHYLLPLQIISRSLSTYILPTRVNFIFVVCQTYCLAGLRDICINKTYQKIHSRFDCVSAFIKLSCYADYSLFGEPHSFK